MHQIRALIWAKITGYTRKSRQDKTRQLSLYGSNYNNNTSQGTLLKKAQQYLLEKCHKGISQ